MTHITGCQIEQLDHAACKSWLDFVLGRGIAPIENLLGTPAWALCHCDDGVTWGLYKDSAWHLASSAFPELSPAPSELSLQEMRVFSREAEVLLWRTENGLRGRILRDTTDGDRQEPLRPDDEDRLLLFGQVIEQRGDFTHVRDGSGAQQVLPICIAVGQASRWPTLRVRHYFARDDRSGVVRVVATRLMEVK